MERYQRIIAEEVRYAREFTSEDARSAAIAVWNIHDNYHRPHSTAAVLHMTGEPDFSPQTAAPSPCSDLGGIPASGPSRWGSAVFVAGGNRGGAVV